MTKAFVSGFLGAGAGLACAAALTAPAWLSVAMPPRPPVAGEGSDAVEVFIEGASPDLVDYTDPATGCTYLVGRRGGVTPRLDAVGRPMCRGGR